MKKTLISLAAAATLAISLSATANAGVGFDFGVDGGGKPHFGVHVSDGGYYGPGYYDSGYDDSSDCYNKWVTSWHWNAWHTYKIKSVNKVWVCD